MPSLAESAHMLDALSGDMDKTHPSAAKAFREEAARDPDKWSWSIREADRRARADLKREVAALECDHALSVKTGMTRLTIPVQHQRECHACGAVFWAIPANTGESFAALRALGDKNHD